MPIKDPEARRANHSRYMREVWYPLNKKKHVARVRVQNQKKLDFLRSFKIKCSRCSETHPACLDFHHRDPQHKLFNVGAVVQGGWSMTKLIAEIAKCDVVCSNCHRKEHFAKHYPDFQMQGGQVAKSPAS